MKDLIVLHSLPEKKFYIDFPEGEAALHYSKVDDHTLDFYSTFVPPALRGENIAALLVQAGLDYARQENCEVIPSCPYVSIYLKRHQKN